MESLAGSSSPEGAPAVTLEREPMQLTIEQMEEKQREMIVRNAKMSLESYREFRSQTEKRYKEKLSTITNDKNPRLEEALMETKLLKGKLTRRDDIIKGLRKQLTIETVRAKIGTADDTKARISESNQEEENKLAVLQDRIAELESQNTKLQNEMTDVQTKLAQSRSRCRDLQMEVDRRETQLREKGRDAELDKSIVNNQLKEREAAIEKLTKVLDDTMAELTAANAKLAGKESLVETMQSDQKRMTETTEKAQKERNEAVEKMEGMDEKIKDSDEVIQLMRDENKDLYQRYETLVVELDKMVEEGYVIPKDGAKRRNNNNNRNKKAGGGGGASKLRRSTSKLLRDSSSMLELDGEDDDYYDDDDDDYTPAVRGGGGGGGLSRNYSTSKMGRQSSVGAMNKSPSKSGLNRVNSSKNGLNRVSSKSGLNRVNSSKNGLNRVSSKSNISKKVSSPSRGNRRSKASLQDDDDEEEEEDDDDFGSVAGDDDYFEGEDGFGGDGGGQSSSGGDTPTAGKKSGKGKKKSTKKMTKQQNSNNINNNMGNNSFVSPFVKPGGADLARLGSKLKFGVPIGDLLLAADQGGGSSSGASSKRPSLTPMESIQQGLTSSAAPGRSQSKFLFPPRAAPGSESTHLLGAGLASRSSLGSTLASSIHAQMVGGGSQLALSNNSSEEDLEHRTQRRGAGGGKRGAKSGSGGGDDSSDGSQRGTNGVTSFAARMKKEDELAKLKLQVGALARQETVSSAQKESLTEKLEQAREEISQLQLKALEKEAAQNLLEKKLLADISSMKVQIMVLEGQKGLGNTNTGGRRTRANGSMSDNDGGQWSDDETPAGAVVKRPSIFYGGISLEPLKISDLPQQQQQHTSPKRASVASVSIPGAGSANKGVRLNKLEVQREDLDDSDSDTEKDSDTDNNTTAAETLKQTTIRKQTQAQLTSSNFNASKKQVSARRASVATARGPPALFLDSLKEQQRATSTSRRASISADSNGNGSDTTKDSSHNSKSKSASTPANTPSEPTTIPPVPAKDIPAVPSVPVKDTPVAVSGTTTSDIQQLKSNRSSGDLLDLPSIQQQLGYDQTGTRAHGRFIDTVAQPTPIPQHNHDSESNNASTSFKIGSALEALDAPSPMLSSGIQTPEELEALVMTPRAAAATAPDMAGIEEEEDEEKEQQKQGDSYRGGNKEPALPQQQIVADGSPKSPHFNIAPLLTSLRAETADSASVPPPSNNIMVPPARMDDLIEKLNALKPASENNDTEISAKEKEILERLVMDDLLREVDSIKKIHSAEQQQEQSNTSGGRFAIDDLLIDAIVDIRSGSDSTGAGASSGPRGGGHSESPSRRSSRRNSRTNPSSYERSRGGRKAQEEEEAAREEVRRRIQREIAKRVAQIVTVEKAQWEARYIAEQKRVEEEDLEVKLFLNTKECQAMPYTVETGMQTTIVNFVSKECQVNRNELDEAADDYLLRMFQQLRALSKLQVPYKDFETTLMPPHEDQSDPSLPGGKSKPVNASANKSAYISSKMPPPDQLPTAQESNWRMKRALVYVCAANALRNRFVRDITGNPYWDTVNTRTLVRCVDLVIQTVHHFLSPRGRDPNVEYPELLQSLTIQNEDVTDAAAKINVRATLAGAAPAKKQPNRSSPPKGRTTGGRSNSPAKRATTAQTIADNIAELMASPGENPMGFSDSVLSVGGSHVYGDLALERMDSSVTDNIPIDVRAFVTDTEMVADVANEYGRTNELVGRDKQQFMSDMMRQKMSQPNLGVDGGYGGANKGFISVSTGTGTGADLLLSPAGGAASALASIAGLSSMFSKGSPRYSSSPLGSSSSSSKRRVGVFGGHTERARTVSGADLILDSMERKILEIDKDKRESELLLSASMKIVSDAGGMVETKDESSLLGFSDSVVSASSVQGEEPPSSVGELLLGRPIPSTIEPPSSNHAATVRTASTENSIVPGDPIYGGWMDDDAVATEENRGRNRQQLLLIKSYHNDPAAATAQGTGKELHTHEYPTKDDMLLIRVDKKTGDKIIQVREFDPDAPDKVVNKNVPGYERPANSILPKIGGRFLVDHDFAGGISDPVLNELTAMTEAARLAAATAAADKAAALADAEARAAKKAVAAVAAAAATRARSPQRGGGMRMPVPPADPRSSAAVANAAAGLDTMPITSRALRGRVISAKDAPAPADTAAAKKHGHHHGTAAAVGAVVATTTAATDGDPAKKREQEEEVLAAKKHNFEEFLKLVASKGVKLAAEETEKNLGGNHHPPYPYAAGIQQAGEALPAPPAAASSIENMLQQYQQHTGNPAYDSRRGRTIGALAQTNIAVKPETVVVGPGGLAGKTLQLNKTSANIALTPAGTVAVAAGEKELAAGAGARPTAATSTVAQRVRKSDSPPKKTATAAAGDRQSADTATGLASGASSRDNFSSPSGLGTQSLVEMSVDSIHIEEEDSTTTTSAVVDKKQGGAGGRAAAAVAAASGATSVTVPRAKMVMISNNSSAASIASDKSPPPPSTTLKAAGSGSTATSAAAGAAAGAAVAVTAAAKKSSSTEAAASKPRVATVSAAAGKTDTNTDTSKKQIVTPRSSNNNKGGGGAGGASASAGAATNKAPVSATSKNGGVTSASAPVSNKSKPMTGSVVVAAKATAAAAAKTVAAAAVAAQGHSQGQPQGHSQGQSPRVAGNGEESSLAVAGSLAKPKGREKVTGAVVL